MINLNKSSFNNIYYKYTVTNKYVKINSTKNVF